MAGSPKQHSKWGDGWCDCVVIPEEAPLTPSEVKRLAHGAEVIILWSGGNGPHPYRIFYWFERQHWLSNSDWEKFHEDPNGHAGIENYMRWQDPIDFVGDQPFHTKVWRL